MKKISLYMLALLTTVLAACGDDYAAPAQPQSNPQESALQSSAINFTPEALTSINLPQLIETDAPVKLGSVSVNGEMPANTVMKARIDVSRDADFSNAVTIDGESMEASGDVAVLPSSLQAAYYNSFTHNPNTAQLYMRVRLFTVSGGTSEAIVGTPGENYYGNYSLQFTPVNEKGIYIAPAYYAVVKALDGGWTEFKCEHSEKDVYDDPVFTVTIDAVKDNAGVRYDTQYYIVAEEDLAAFKGGATDKAFGQGEGEALLKGGPAFTGPASDGASKYNITLNMEKATIVSEAEVHLECYYLLGYNNMQMVAPESSRNYMLYKTGETTFTYTTFWPNNAGGKSYFNVKVWEREAMENNNTTQTWGFSGRATAVRPAEGDLVQPGQNFGPTTEGWYTLNITMDEENNKHSYSWTAIEAPTTEYTSISLIGTINGSNWDKDFDLTQCDKAPHNWCLLGFELTADAKLKFRANHEWNGDWGGDGSQPISPVVYTLPAGSTDITVPAGTYDFYLNDITGQWSILKK